MEVSSFTCPPRSWPSLFAVGILAVFLGLLLFLEPALSLRLVLYSIGALAVIVAVISLAAAAFLSRGGGWPFGVTLVFGILMLFVAFIAFSNPDLLGGILATLAGAILIVGGLGVAITGAFSLHPPARKFAQVTGGGGLLAIGLLLVFRSGLAVTLIVRVIGIFILALGGVLLAVAVLGWLKDRRSPPDWVDVTVR
ncbi:MAG: DUF308 domain-containing protein [Methanolinea sp.]|nr:DUF308 domain-containing protein [Methanolinea sp.]